MKELVEHIRTVHFTILVIALAMTAALQLQPHKPIERAADDAAAILATSQRWNDTEKALSSAIDSAMDEKGLYGIKVVDIRTHLPLPNAPSVIRAPLAPAGTTFSVQPNPSQKQLRVAFTLDRPWIFLNSDGMLQSDLPQWNTLGSFLEEWDTIHNDSTGIFPIILSTNRADSTCQDLRVEKIDPKAIPINLPKDYGQLSIFMQNRVLSPSLVGSGFVCRFDTVPEGHISIDLGRALLPITSQQIPWRNSTSHEAFPELIQSAHLLEGISLTDLAQILRERANEEPERIEIFQTKFPTPAIPTFGSAILISCEVYLFFHLFELRASSQSESNREWITGYIGLYPNTLAFGFTIITLTIFPLVPLALSARHETGIPKLLSIASMVLSLFLGGACSWILRSVQTLLHSRAFSKAKIAKSDGCDT